MKVYLVCSIVVGWNRQKGVSGDARYFFLHGIAGSYQIFLFLQFCSYNFIPTILFLQFYSYNFIPTRLPQI
jgi:hypothetical protein